jgi:hypothetical protein
MEFTFDIHLPATPSERGRAEMVDATNRVLAAVVAAIAEPGNSTHRVHLANALNYIDTVARQERARPTDATPHLERMPTFANEFMAKFPPA